jgi:D-alanyl-lipoteichoic acid acyltransferase DltB (MBOAT superfamily)
MLPIIRVRRYVLAGFGGTSEWMRSYLNTLADITLPEMEVLRQYRDDLLGGQAFSDWHSLWTTFSRFLHDLWATGAFADWRNSWLPVFSDRFLVVYFAPLLLLLLLLPQRHLRTGIIATGLVFMAYVFGALYPFIWLAQCVIFYRLSEAFAIEAKRKDVLQWGPPTAAVMCVGGWYIVSLALSGVHFPGPISAWMNENLVWLYPLGSRPLPWESVWAWQPDKPPVQLFFALFFLPQVNGIVIFTIRMMHYFSEIKRDTIPPDQRSLGRFIAFCTFAPTMIAGPIERYREFNYEIDHCRENRNWRETLYGLWRIALGLGKHIFNILIFGPLVYGWVVNSGYYSHPENIRSYWALLISIQLQVFCLYLNFSGYCDVGIGMGRILGYRVIENFDHYWVSASLTEAWRRWHISFSFILRDYFFIPLARRRWNVLLALIVTFTVCGLMHNLALTFVVWGAVMGCMIAINQRWSRWMRSLDRQPHQALAAVRRQWMRLQPVPHLCSWFITMNFLCGSALVIMNDSVKDDAGIQGWRVIWELVRRPLSALLGMFGVEWQGIPHV